MDQFNQPGWNWIFPLWSVAVGTVAASALLWGFTLLLRLVAPKVSAVAWSTAKECRSQPLFYAVIALAFVLVLLAAFLPYGTLGDDIKMMKDTGLMMILVLSVVLAVASAGISISDEVEGRTALTVLSKPIGRRQFVIGKFIGVLLPVLVYYIALGTWLLIITSYKVKFEARESALPEPTWVQCQTEIFLTIPPLLLAFFETVVLTAISVALSTRLAMVPNLLICLTIFLVGHLMPLIVQTSVGKEPIVAFMSQLLSTVLPVLEHFNVEAAIASGRDATLTAAEWLTYLAWAGGYCLLYTTLMMLTSLLLFEDRDLA